MPEGWMCSRSGADLNIFAPSLGITMQTTVQVSVPVAGLQIPAEGVQVEVLGQADTVVPATVNGDMLELNIPAKAWAGAVEYMPVIRLKGVVR
jgi:hypothetical protein